jgi:hypothetical protein
MLNRIGSNKEDGGKHWNILSNLSNSYSLPARAECWTNMTWQIIILGWFKDSVDSLDNVQEAWKNKIDEVLAQRERGNAQEASKEAADRTIAIVGIVKGKGNDKLGS